MSGYAAWTTHKQGSGAKTNAETFPGVKKLVDLGLQSKQFVFDPKGQSEAGKIFQGLSPSKDGTTLDATQQAPAGVPSVIAEERFEEFAPGLDPELLKLIQATADMELAEVDAMFGPVAESPSASAPAGKKPAAKK